MNHEEDLRYNTMTFLENWERWWRALVPLSTYLGYSLRTHSGRFCFKLSKNYLVNEADISNTIIGIIIFEQNLAISTTVTTYIQTLPNVHYMLYNIYPFLFHYISALSFYRSKMILDRPNCFGQVQILSFGCIQIILVRFKLLFPGLFFLIWTCPKWFGPDQNKLDTSKTSCIRPKWFGRS